jgi:cyclopropane fatty-acyl-phospholipid synthase-like methyltransferase
LISLKDTAKDTAPIDFLKLLDIHAIVGDARHIALPDKSIDLINSNNTFEHIYPSILIDILREFKRLLSANGVMTHQIDMSDHFAHLDKSITIYNFLQFTDKQWEWIDNSIQPQNRLRLSEYQKIYQQVGLTINETYNREGNLELLRSVKLSDNYKDFDEKDLAVSHSLLISKN